MANRWNFLQGSGLCRKCSDKKRSISYVEVKKEIEKENCQLLSKDYSGCHKKLQIICSCGEDFVTSLIEFRSGRRCKSCWIKRISGPNCHLWKKELTEEDRINRNRRRGVVYNRWKLRVKQRDKYECKICKTNVKGYRKANIHHLESFTENEKLRTKMSNGITLCPVCHKLFHDQYGRGKNTREQFVEFQSSFNLIR